MVTKTNRATIEDVARLAGVSIATVSAVVNGSVPVSPKRTKAVREAMAALNYRRNERGRSLRTGKSFVIGTVVGDISNPFFPQLIRHIEGFARQEGYSLMLCDSAHDPENERRHLETLQARGVDGALCTAIDSAAPFDWLQELGMPVVFVERGPASGPFATVGTDNVAAASLGAQHLLELGHERIAILLTRATATSNIARIDGFCRTLEQAGVAVPPEFIVTELSQTEDAAAAVRNLLQADPATRPTALICGNGLLVLGASRAVRDCGLECPEDVSILGFDHTPWSENFNPPMTTLAQQIAVVAHQAVRLLLDQIRGEAAQAAPALVPAELRVRSSTSAVRVLSVAG